jgi:arylformamidase
VIDKRVSFDFEVDFSNGGGMQGQGFRLDIGGDGVTDDELAAYLIRDLRLLMVGKVRILNKRIIEERHKRTAAMEQGESAATGAEFIDLSHEIESGMITYKGLPAPLVCDHLSRVQSRTVYEAGTEFQIGRIEMVANTGTYLDTPYHRYADGYDLTGLPLERVSDLSMLPIEGFRFSAVPPKIAAMGTFPVRAHARLRQDAQTSASCT